MEALPVDFRISAIVAGIRDGRFTAESVARDVIRRFEKFAHLGAVIRYDPEALVEAARCADRLRDPAAQTGPLHGVPILVKDNIDTKDLPSSAGTPALENDFPRQNAAVVERLLNAGALIAGKANLYELAVGGTSLNQHFGRVANPWDLDRIPGGSSSGSAAAVAARLVPGALGTDTNGSVRGPCSLAGIAGFRPSFQRYPGAGVMPVTPTRDSVGIMANSLEDLALLDATLSGERPVSEVVDLAGIRFGRPRGDYYRVMDDRTAAVIDDAVSLLAEHGATIVDADIPGLAALTAKTAWTISAYEVPRDIDAYLESRGTRLSLEEIVSRIASPVVRERFNPRSVDLQALDGPYRKAMQLYRPRLQKMLENYFDEHAVDAIVFPTTPFPAPAIDDDDADLVVNGELITGGFAAVINNTVYQSAAGIPSLVVPAGLTHDGLPVGMSFDGPAGSDRRLLAIGAAFEKIRGPFPLPPLD